MHARPHNTHLCCHGQHKTHVHALWGLAVYVQVAPAPHAPDTGCLNALRLSCKCILLSPSLHLKGLSRPARTFTYIHILLPLPHMHVLLTLPPTRPISHSPSTYADRAAMRLMASTCSRKEAAVKGRRNSASTDSRVGKNWGLKPPAVGHSVGSHEHGAGCNATTLRQR